MRTIREALRLRWQCGLSTCDIAASCRVSATAVRGYIHRAEHCGLGWPLPEHLPQQPGSLLVMWVARHRRRLAKTLHNYNNFRDSSESSEAGEPTCGNHGVYNFGAMSHRSLPLDKWRKGTPPGSQSTRRLRSDCKETAPSFCNRVRCNSDWFRHCNFAWEPHRSWSAQCRLGAIVSLRDPFRHHPAMDKNAKKQMREPLLTARQIPTV